MRATRSEREAPSDAAVDTRAAELMARYCDGQRRAFDELYASVAPRVLGYLTSMVRDRSTAEDLLQQTFIKLHQARSAYVRGADPVPWIYTIAYRTCLDEMRRQKRARLRASLQDAAAPVPVADITGTLDGEEEGGEAAIRAERLARGLRALGSLPRQQREAVVLTKLEGRSTAEVAALLGTSAGAVKLRAHRGYVALRRLLGAEDEL